MGKGDKGSARCGKCDKGIMWESAKIIARERITKRREFRKGVELVTYKSNGS